MRRYIHTIKEKVITRFPRGSARVSLGESMPDHKWGRLRGQAAGIACQVERKNNRIAAPMLITMADPRLPVARAVQARTTIRSHAFNIEALARYHA